jgi:hypothetical protein
MSMCRPRPPAHTLRNSLKLRNLHRFAGVDVRNGLAMVQRQYFLSAPQWVTLFQVERILLYNLTFQRSVVRCGALFYAACNGHIIHLLLVVCVSV